MNPPIEKDPQDLPVTAYVFAYVVAVFLFLGRPAVPAALRRLEAFLLKELLIALRELEVLFAVHALNIFTWHIFWFY